jgi:hypothetical protein
LRSEHTGTHELFYRLNEVDTRFNGIDIHEDFVLREVLRQAIVNQPGPCRVIFATVTDEDLPTHFAMSHLLPEYGSQTALDFVPLLLAAI